MPSGLTIDVIEGCSFEHFIMRCARQMGALIVMRDEPWDAPIPERFEPSTFYADRIPALEAEIERLWNMEYPEKADAAEEDYQVRRRDYDKNVAKSREARQACEAMLERVQAWAPPTQDHHGLKALMVQQLQETIRFDGEPVLKPPTRKEPGEWWEAAIAAANGNLRRAITENEKEIQRTEERNAWLKALRESLQEQEVSGE